MSAASLPLGRTRLVRLADTTDQDQQGIRAGGFLFFFFFWGEGGGRQGRRGGGRLLRLFFSSRVFVVGLGFAHKTLLLLLGGFGWWALGLWGDLRGSVLGKQVLGFRQV